MESYTWMLTIPIVWYLISIGYQIIKLIKLWLKYKFENIKIKELRIWD
jgi:hypothetical protein